MKYVGCARFFCTPCMINKVRKKSSEPYAPRYTFSRDPVTFVKAELINGVKLVNLSWLVLRMLKRNRQRDYSGCPCPHRFAASA